MRTLLVCLATFVLGAAIALGSYEVTDAQVKISSLPAASALAGGELLPAVQGGVDVVVTPNQIKTFTGGGGGGEFRPPQRVFGPACSTTTPAAFGGFTLAGDCTIAVPTISCLGTNGTAFGTFATQNYATPPAIGATTPAAGSFSALNDSALTASVNVCAEASKHLTSA